MCEMQQKAVLRGEFIAMNVNFRKEGRYKINNLNFCFRKLQKNLNLK